MSARFNRLVGALIALALAAPAAASAADFDPSDEFKLKDWVPIHLGGLTSRSTARSSTCWSARRSRACSGSA